MTSSLLHRPHSGTLLCSHDMVSTSVSDPRESKTETKMLLTTWSWKSYSPLPQYRHLHRPAQCRERREYTRHECLERRLNGGQLLRLVNTLLRYWLNKNFNLLKCYRTIEKKEATYMCCYEKIPKIHNKVCETHIYMFIINSLVSYKSRNRCIITSICIRA